MKNETGQHIRMVYLDQTNATMTNVN